MNTSGLDHINLTVSDLERSRRFYGDLLGFDLSQTPVDYANPFAAGTYYFMVGEVEINLVAHQSTPSGDRFDETRIGLDHLSFRAPDEAALHALVETLDDAGVENSGVQVYAPNGKQYVVFRDPDNIQLEYWLDRPGLRECGDSEK
jgi:catechol 2,3-dioxygenase-like lactoylglutathione lyase family enzyme